MVLAARTSGGVSVSIAMNRRMMVRAHTLAAERQRRRFFRDGGGGQHANDMQETLLLVWLGHADDGAEGMRG